jgi:membrane protease YdiL (CAAX protease family)
MAGTAFFLPDRLKVPEFRLFWPRYVGLLVLAVGWVLANEFSEHWIHADREQQTVYVAGIPIPFASDESGSASLLGSTFQEFARTIDLLTYDCISLLFILLALTVYGWRRLWDGLAGHSLLMVGKYILVVTAIMILATYGIAWLGGYSSDPQRRAPSSWVTVIISSFTVGLMAPVAEELAVRFIFFQMLRSLKRFLFAGLLSGALFGLLHYGYPDPRKIALTAGAGLVMAWAYERTCSILTPIGIHVANNSWWLIADWLF